MTQELFEATHAVPVTVPNQAAPTTQSIAPPANPAVGSNAARAQARFVASRASDVTALAVALAAYGSLAGRITFQQVTWAALYITAASVMDAIKPRHTWSYIEEAVQAGRVGVVAIILMGVGAVIDIPMSRTLLVTYLLTLIVTRPLSAAISDRAIKCNGLKQRVLLICDDDEYEAFQDAVECHQAAHLKVVAVLRDESTLDHVDLNRGVRFAGVAKLREICHALRPSRIVFGSSRQRDALLIEGLTDINEMGVAVRPFARAFEEEFGRVPIVSLDTSWFLFDIGPLHHVGYRALRRVVDLIAGTIAALAFCFAWPIVALAIKMDSRGPVLYHQTRIGQDDKTFRIHKFRTMTTDAEATGPQFAAATDSRITRVGNLLRRSRLDELPQALNLLKGEMSLIGPRPERPEFVGDFEKVIPFYSKRHLIKPGLTGWAQVHEGYGASVEDTVRKLERDLYYLKHQSLLLDLRIVASTASSVLRLAGR